MTETIILALVALGLALLVLWRLGVGKDVLERIDPTKPLPARDPQSPGSWTAGPIVRGENRSPRSVKRLLAGGILAIDIPHGPVVGDQLGELSGVTYPCGPLTDKIGMKAVIRVVADPGVQLIPSQPGGGAAATLFFQRFGDNWSAKGRFEDDRWYATFATVQPIEPNRSYEIEAFFSQNWTATQTSSAASNPAGFNDALAHAEQAGIVFGGGDGYAHGFYATGPAYLVLERWEMF